MPLVLAISAGIILSAYSYDTTFVDNTLMEKWNSGITIQDFERHEHAYACWTSYRIRIDETVE